MRDDAANGGAGETRAIWRERALSTEREAAHVARSSPTPRCGVECAATARRRLARAGVSFALRACNAAQALAPRAGVPRRQSRVRAQRSSDSEPRASRVARPPCGMMEAQQFATRARTRPTEIVTEPERCSQEA
jgi:hypothetical protein